MINIKRLMENLNSIAGIGRGESGGITRLAFSEEHFKASEELKNLAKSKGYEVKTDRVGNLFIIYNPKNNDKYIMIGSHLDTVKEGGLYDGALGVFSAFEVLDVIKENKINLKHGIIVVAFNAEEGSEMGATFGSRTICGRNNFNDKTLTDRLSVYGLTAEDVKESEIDFSNIIAFVELHIEQGGILDLENLDIGIVNGIVGIDSYDIILKGTANHGGTTPMKLRDDPIRNLPNIITKIYEFADKYSDPFVMTIGNIIVSPGMYNIVPGEVKILIESRDLNQNNIDRFFGELGQFLKDSNFKYEYIKNIGNPSVILDEEIINTIEDVVKSKGYSYKIMSSGAGHDAEEISHIIPTAMIFVPSVGGVSHSPKEYTTEEQIKKGAEVYLDTVLKLDENLK